MIHLKIMQIISLETLIYILSILFSLTYFFNESIANTFIRIAFFLGLIQLLKNKQIKINWIFYKKYLFPIFIFFISLFFSLFFSINFCNSILTYESFLKTLIPFFTILLYINGKAKICTLFIFLLIGFLSNDIFAIYNYFHFNYTRVGGFNNQVITLAGMLLLHIPLILSLLIKSKFKSIYTLILFSALIISLLTLIFNATRMAWFIIIIDFIILNFLLIKSWKNKFAIFITIIISIITLYSFNSNINDRINTLFNYNNVSTRGHYYYLRDGFNIFLNNNYWGIGLNNFQEVMLSNSYLSAESKQNLQHDGAVKIGNNLVMSHAHNDFIMFLVESGVIGGLAYIYFFITLIYLLLKNYFITNNIICLGMLLLTINLLIRGLSDYNFAMLNVITIYFFILSIYLKYLTSMKYFCNTIKIYSYKNIIYLYISIIFIILLRIFSRYFLT
ncbi:O-antigen ligase family protein [Megamonas hypermegale]|uniref:O-antigen ligase family protein n=2 Tax=Megamonas hypermegale TaxID=158847 RepID=UPI0026F345E5|nr:O-antigen ligase family protein [Megamonas hypermegale]